MLVKLFLYCFSGVFAVRVCPGLFTSETGACAFQYHGYSRYSRLEIVPHRHPTCHYIPGRTEVCWSIESSCYRQWSLSCVLQWHPFSHILYSVLCHDLGLNSQSYLLQNLSNPFCFSDCKNTPYKVTKSEINNRRLIWGLVSDLKLLLIHKEAVWSSI